MKSVTEIDFRAIVAARGYFPSPSAWEDMVLYFLMLDRFSDGKENGCRDVNGAIVTTGTTPLYQPADRGTLGRKTWERNGQGWQGGTLRGLASKLGYLQRLGITAIWISPILKQAARSDSYHGYAIQNFLEVDPRFGSSADLQQLVSAAHQLNIRVILDIILNHSGDVFEYNADRYPEPDGHGGTRMDPRWDGRPFAVKGFRDAHGNPTIPWENAPSGAGLEDAIWPVELQEPAAFGCKGKITNWDYDPEFREGDFISLKDIYHGSGPAAQYAPSPALIALTSVYKYWIAFADLDGFRIDTVKHMDLGAARYFNEEIHEFAQSLGKENFYLIGEVTGGRGFAIETVETTGLNAGLGIADIPGKLDAIVKGKEAPEDYFDLFRNSLLVHKNSHTWFRDRVVTMVDDHDQVWRGRWKARFAAYDRGSEFILNALALNATTLGIPCVYYGSEQAFDGHSVEDRDGNDLFLRENMFGGGFGPHESQGRHCFDESFAVYQELSKILAVRRTSQALRRGRQYLRQISGDGVNFGYPRPVDGQMKAVVAWSRLFAGEELVCAINTDPDQATAAWVTVDAGLHKMGDSFKCLYGQATAPPTLAVAARNGAAIHVTVPPAGFVIYQRT